MENKERYEKCVEACRKIMLTVDYSNDYCAGEERCRIAVNTLSNGKINYMRPMSEALLNLGVDI